MRNIKEKLLEIEELATLDVDIAMSCFYVLFNEDKPFIGVSVRFAEIIASCWGEIESGTTVVSNSDGRSITVTGFVKDLQKNSNFSVQILRRTVNFNGSRMSSEQITQTTNVASSIAFRNVIFKAIPAALFTSVLKKIKKYIVDNIDETDVLGLVMEYFSSKGISESDVMNKILVKSLVGLSADNIFLLIGIKNAIEEGDATANEIFGKEEPKPQRKSRFSFSSDDDVNPSEEISIPKEEVLSDKEALKKGIAELSVNEEDKKEKSILVKEDVLSDLVDEAKEKVVKKRGRGRPKKN